MLRIFIPNYKERNIVNGIQFRSDFFPKNLIELFPKIETIECHFKFLFHPSKRKIFDHVKKLRVTCEENIGIMEWINDNNSSIMHKIETINFENISGSNNNQTTNDETYKLKIDKTIFPNVKRIVLFDILNVNSFLMNNYNVDLDKIVLKYSWKFFTVNCQKIIEELKTMKQYKMIKEKTLMIWPINPMILKELKSIFDIVLCLDLKTLDGDEYYFEKDKTIDLKNIFRYLNDKNIFSFKECIHQIDMRKCLSLERIFIGKDFFTTIKIEGLQNLKELEFVNNMNTYDITKIPQTVTKLVCLNFTPNQDISHVLWLNPQIKSLKIIHNDENKNVLNTFSILPRKDIELDEIIFQVNDISKDKYLLDLSPFFNLSNYPKIKHKTLIIKCFQCQPKYETVNELRKIINVIIEIPSLKNNMINNSYVDINESLKNIKLLPVMTNFDWRFIDNPQILINVHKIVGLYPPDSPSRNYLILEGFTNCRKLKIRLPYTNISFPPHLKELDVECDGNSFEYDLSNIPKLKKLKLTNNSAKNKYYFIPPNDFDYLIINGRNIFILDEHKITNGERQEFRYLREE